MTGKRKNQLNRGSDPFLKKETTTMPFHEDDTEAPVSDAVEYPTRNVVHKCGTTSAMAVAPGHDFKTQGAYCSGCRNWYGASEFSFETGEPLD